MTVHFMVAEKAFFKKEAATKAFRLVNRFVRLNSARSVCFQSISCLHRVCTIASAVRAASVLNTDSGIRPSSLSWTLPGSTVPVETAAPRGASRPDVLLGGGKGFAAASLWWHRRPSFARHLRDDCPQHGALASPILLQTTALARRKRAGLALKTEEASAL